MLKKLLLTLIIGSLVLGLVGCGCGSDEGDELNLDVTVEGKEKVINEKGLEVSVPEQNFKNGVLRLTVSNNSNKDISVALLKTLVNNISLNQTTGTVSVTKKKTKDLVLTFNKKELEENNIGPVSSIKMAITAIDKDTYKEIASSGYFELKTSSDYEQDLSANGNEIFDKAGVNVYFENKEIKKGNLIFNVKIINKRNDTVFINVGDTMVNNAKFNTSFIYDTLPSKSLENARIIITKGDLDQYNVNASDIKWANVSISVYSTKTYEKLASSDNIKLK